MDETLKGALREGEKVLWEGRPEKVNLFEKSGASGLIFRWALCGIFVVLALFYWLYYAPSISVAESQARTVSLIVILIAGYIALLPILSLNILRNKIFYAITNERFIAYKAKSSIVQYREFSDMTEATVVSLPTGMSNLFIGPLTPQIQKRVHDDLIEYKDEHKMDPLVFASIKNADAALAVMPAHVAVTGGKAKRSVA